MFRLLRGMQQIFNRLQKAHINMYNFNFTTILYNNLFNVIILVYFKYLRYSKAQE